MREVLIKLLIVPAATVLLFFMMFPATSYGAAPKIRHSISVYNDNAGENPRQLKRPGGVGCNDSFFIVADSGNGRLLQYTFRDGNVKTEAEFKLSQLMNPLKVEINSKGEIYALDGKQRRIVRLGPDGKFMGSIDPKGLPSPVAFVPRSFDIDMNDNIYVLDIFSSRVLVLNPEGEYQNQIKFPQGYGYFSDISVDFKGDILLLDSVQARVLSAKKHAASFSPLTESVRNLREHIRFPVNLTTDERGRIFLIDRNGGLIIVLGQDGSFLGQASSFGMKEGLLNYPSQACINTEGKVFIADTHNNRVQIFELLR